MTVSLAASRLPVKSSSKHPNASILVIDDIAEVRDYLKANLAQHYSSVHSVASASAARTYLKSNTIDAIVCDLVMPGEDGINFLKSLKLNPQTPAVVICSGSITHEGTHEFLRQSFRKDSNPPLALHYKFLPIADLVGEIDRQIDHQQIDATRFNAALNLISLGNTAKRATEVIADEFAQVARTGLAKLANHLDDLVVKSDFYATSWREKHLPKFTASLAKLSTIRRSELTSEFPEAGVSAMHTYENLLVAVLPPSESDFTDNEQARFSEKTKTALTAMKTDFAKMLERLSEIKHKFSGHIADEFDPLRFVNDLVQAIGTRRIEIPLLDSSSNLSLSDPDKLSRNLLQKTVQAVLASRFPGNTFVRGRLLINNQITDSFVSRSAKRINAADLIEVTFAFSEGKKEQLIKQLDQLAADISRSKDSCFIKFENNDFITALTLYFKASDLIESTEAKVSVKKTELAFDLNILKDLKPTLYEHSSGPLVCLDFKFERLDQLLGFGGPKLAAYEHEGVLFLAASNSSHAMAFKQIAEAVLKLTGEDRDYISYEAGKCYDSGVRINLSTRFHEVNIENSASGKRTFAAFTELAPDYKVNLGGVGGRASSGSIFFD